MIIDAHVHLARDQAPAAQWLKAPATPATLLRQMDRAGIAAAVVLALPGLQSAQEILGLCAEARDRLFPLLGVDPRSAADVGAIAHARDMGFYGLKVHPRLSQVGVDAKTWGPVLQQAIEHRLTVLFDALPQSAHAPLEQMEYHAFDRLARQFPQATLVLAHACAPHVLGAYTLAKANRNVYLDISLVVLYYAGSSVANDVAFLSDRLDRFTVYGSDFPQYPADEYLAAYRNLIDNRPGVDRARILAGNAIDLYHLPLKLP